MRSRLLKELDDQTKVMSSVEQMKRTPAYREILRSGQSAVPVLLDALRQEADMAIMAALADITNADPVPQQVRGNVRAMSKAWLAWGQQWKPSPPG